jgi:hypothetical protein
MAVVEAALGDARSFVNARGPAPSQTKHGSDNVTAGSPNEKTLFLSQMIGRELVARSELTIYR